MTVMKPMQKTLVDVCVAMSKDIFEINTGRKPTEAEFIRVAEYLYKCSTQGALSLYAGAAPDEEVDYLVDRLCSTPLIEDLAVSRSDWESCETVQDVYDMTKRKIRAAFEIIRSEP